MTMFTSTLAWFTLCVERARRAHSSTLDDVISQFIGSSPESFHNHLQCHPWAHLFDSLLPFYPYLFFPVFSSYLLHSELCLQLDNPIVKESLCYSANKGVTTPTTSPPPSQIMSPTSRPSASSTTHRFPSPSLSWPITANQEAQLFVA